MPPHVAIFFVFLVEMGFCQVAQAAKLFIYSVQKELVFFNNSKKADTDFLLSRVGISLVEHLPFCLAEFFIV